MNKVEKELQDATGVKPKPKEKSQDYLKRLLGAVSEMDDESFKGLSKAAATWANKATVAFDADEDIVGFDDEPAKPAAKSKGKAAASDDDEDEDGEDDSADADEDEPEDETEGEDADEEDDADAEDEDEKPMKKNTKTAVKKAATKKEAQVKKAKAEVKKTTKKAPVERVGVIDALKEVLSGDKALTVAQIHKALLKKFPDRGDAMINTIRTQLSVLPGKGFAIKKVKTDDGVTYQHGTGKKK